MLSFWNIENIRHSHFYKDIQNTTGTKIGNKYQVKITGTSFFYQNLFNVLILSTCKTKTKRYSNLFCLEDQMIWKHSDYLFLLCIKTLAENSVGRMKSLKLTVFVSYLTRKIVLNLM